MIKAADLRIGNLLLHPSHGAIPISINHLLFLSNNPTNQYQPIPLTAEWLERFGFERYLALSAYQLKGDNSFLIQHDKKGEWLIMLLRGHYAEPFATLKYVHQLQNLYFALTGTELQIK